MGGRNDLQFQLKTFLLVYFALRSKHFKIYLFIYWGFLGEEHRIKKIFSYSL